MDKHIKVNFLFTILFLFSVTTGCSEKYTPVKTGNISGDRADRGIQIKNADFDFSDVATIYIYSQEENESELKSLDHISKKLQEKGFNVVIDRGQTLDYTDDDLRIRAYHKLMSIMYHVYIVKPEQAKGNEDVIAVIKADSAPKLARITANFILERKQSGN